MKQLIIFVTFAVLAYAAKVRVEHTSIPTVPSVDNTKVTSESVVSTHNDKDIHSVDHSTGHGSHVPPHMPPSVQHIVEQAHQHVPQVINHHVGVGVTKEAAVPPVPHVPHDSQVHNVPHASEDHHTHTPHVSEAPHGSTVPHISQQPHSTKVPSHLISNGVIVAVTPVGHVSHSTDKVTAPKPNHQIHVDVIHHHSDGHKHVAHNVPNVIVDVTPTDSAGHHHHMVPQAVVDKVKKVEQHIQSVMQQAHQHIPQVINHQIAQKQKHSTSTTPTTTQVPHSAHATEKVPHVAPVPGSDIHNPVIKVNTATA